MSSAPPRNTIFLHLPKCGGSTLRPILFRQYESAAISHLSKDLYEQPAAEQFCSLSKTEREQVRCIAGHGTFGLHERLTGSTEYVTMLRDPVERVISYYYYVLRSPNHRCYDDVVGQERSLHEYVDSGINPELENGMTRDVAGARYETPDEDTLERAKSHLDEHVGVVGLMEHFDESLIAMKRRYGWDRVGYWKRNVSSSRPKKQELPAKTRRLVESKNQLDIELYRYASALFREAREEIEDLDDALRRLQSQCRIRKVQGQALNVVAWPWRAAGSLTRSVLSRFQ